MTNPITHIQQWFLRQRLKRHLAALGKNKHEVAKTLKEQGFVGKPLMAKACPVARYLYSRNQMVKEIRVGANYLYLPPYNQGKENKVCAVPAAVSEFIIDFDNGEFVELVEFLVEKEN